VVQSPLPTLPGDAMRSDARTAHGCQTGRTWGVCTSYQGQTGPAWSQQIKRGLSCRSLVCACSEWVVSELAANLVSACVLGSAMHGKTGMQEAAGHARGVVAVDGRREVGWKGNARARDAGLDPGHL
jgi:hypothetical protein